MPSEQCFEADNAAALGDGLVLNRELLLDQGHDQLGNTGRKTGFWLEELAAPYFVFRGAGVEITLASPKGGQPPLDPKSNEPVFQTEDTRRFERDQAATAALANTLRLSDIKQADYDSVFFPGGHGPLWDLTNDRNALSLIEDMLSAGKPVALVCHAPGILTNVKAPDGKPIAKGRAVTGFTDSEEEAMPTPRSEVRFSSYYTATTPSALPSRTS